MRTSPSRVPICQHRPQRALQLSTCLTPLTDGLVALLHRVDRTYKLYIGGKQARPDAPYAQAITNAQGHTLALIPEANRKDVRNAVEAAHAAFPGWSLRAAHNRAQIVYYLYVARSEPVHAQRGTW